MLFTGQDRDAMRNAWRAAWARHLERKPLSPLQAQMVAVMALHPEYHPQLSVSAGLAPVPKGPDAASDAFLHLGLHLALREQLSTGRPDGIGQIHRRLSTRLNDLHEAEHRMMRVLEQALWQAQRDGRMPDEALYLAALHRL